MLKVEEGSWQVCIWDGLNTQLLHNPDDGDIDGP